MRTLNSVVTLWAAVLCAGLALAQDAVKLEYKWKPGDTLRYELTAKGERKVSLTAEGDKAASPAGPSSVEETLSADLACAVASVNPDGSADLSVKFTRFAYRADITAGTQKTKLELTADGSAVKLTKNGQVIADASKPEASDLSKLKTLLADPVKMRLARTGKLVSLEPVEAVKELGGQALDCAALAKNSQPELSDKPVKPGDSWKLEQSLLLPNVAKPKLTATNAFEKVEQVGGSKCARIAVSGKATADAGAGELNLAGRALKAEKYEQTLSGFVLFDIEAGRLTSQELQTQTTVTGKLEPPADKPDTVRLAGSIIRTLNVTVQAK